MSVLDGLAEYLQEAGSLAELEDFIRRHCCCFPSEEGAELPHECWEIYRRYEALVQSVLADFVEVSKRDLHMVGLASQVTAEAVVKALQEERAFRRPDSPGEQLRALVAIASFEEFAAAARHSRERLPTASAVEVSSPAQPFLPWARTPGFAGMADVVRASAED
mmetsp:Transcript_71845/g.166224  ORF Transcript_71845/g.166224 Transcript_71845/m.166224 type:complete len:164 (-) Transcript_71845:161-652(-)